MAKKKFHPHKYTTDERDFIRSFNNGRPLNMNKQDRPLAEQLADSFNQKFGTSVSVAGLLWQNRKLHGLIVVKPRSKSRKVPHEYTAEQDAFLKSLAAQDALTWPARARSFNKRFGTRVSKRELWQHYRRLCKGLKALGTKQPSASAKQQTVSSGEFAGAKA